MSQLIGIFGGTFNPIHFGHLRVAEELAESLHLDEVRFIPSANPPHKSQPHVSAQQRAAMVQLAIADNPKFKLDICELARTGASYTFDTLEILREELGINASLCLIMGSDAFIKFHTWHRWQELLNLCHIALVQRPKNKAQSSLPAELQNLLHNHYTEYFDDLRHSPSGHIIMQAVTALEISATAIRERLNQGKSAQYLMPDTVLTYIKQHRLYSTLA